MDSFRTALGDVRYRPGMYVGTDDFLLVGTFLNGYDMAMMDLRPDLTDSGLSGFRKWLAVRLDSCVKTDWSEIIFREDTGPDKFEALVRFYDEFAGDRSVRGLNAIPSRFRIEHFCHQPARIRPSVRRSFQRDRISFLSRRSTSMDFPIEQSQPTRGQRSRCSHRVEDRFGAGLERVETEHRVPRDGGEEPFRPSD